MKRTITTTLGVCLALATGLANADPQADIAAFQKYYMEKFPGVTMEQFGDGIYAIDEVRREAWMNFEEFPPYEEGIEKGEKLFHTPFTLPAGNFLAVPLPERLDPPLDAEAGRDVLSHGDDLRLDDLLHRTLGLGIEEPEADDPVAVELDPDRDLPIRRKDVHDPAPLGELTP